MNRLNRGLLGQQNYSTDTVTDTIVLHVLKCTCHYTSLVKTH